MSQKLLIVALTILIGTMCGLMASKKLKKRADYFEALVAFLNLMISEVKFKKSATKDIMRRFMLTNPSPLDEHLNQYISLINIKELNLFASVLTPYERSEMTRLFLSLGTHDSSTQIFELENYKNIFEKIASDTKDKKQKLAPMYIKLGFLAGLAAGILLI